MLVSRNVFNYDQLIKKYFVPGNFLQTTLWRDFLDEQQKKNWQLVVTDEKEEPIATCLLYENKLFFGKSYLYSPKGPLWLKQDLSTGEKQEALELLLSQIRDITIATNDREELFCKLELSETIPEPPQLFKSQNVQPANTWVLDLNKSQEELLANMHTKTRYNIALAQRRGLVISFGQQKNDIEQFLKLLPGTAKRQGVKFHGNKYYRQLWNTLLKHGAGELLFAELKGKVIAANLMINFGKATTYLHGVSDYKNRQAMAPHLLQWEAIKKAKQAGQGVYDFWGICDENGFPKSWQGITRFKQGFGGRQISSPGAYNYIYNKQWYGLYLWLKNFKHWFK